MAQVGVQIDKREEYEIPFHDPGMGQGKFLGFELEVIVKEQIKVDDARSVLPDNFFAEILLGRLQLFK